MKKTLVDTSLWIEHLRRPNTELIALLKSRRILTHSAVMGELACGGLFKKEEILSDFLSLPRAVEASFEETIDYLHRHRLYSKGVGWVDIQLLASAALSEATILSLDKNLMRFST